jgi:hypothetical protein
LVSITPGIELDVLTSLKNKSSSPAKVNVVLSCTVMVVDLSFEQVYAAVNAADPQMEADDSVLPAIALPARAKEITVVASIRTKFWCILALLFVALLIIMIITITSLKEDGATWMDQTTADMTSQQVAQLSSVANSKSLFIEVS